MAEMSTVTKSHALDCHLKVERRRIERKSEHLTDIDYSCMRQYSDHPSETTGQFADYFYPWEQIYLRTNNFEKYSDRQKRTSKYFRKEGELFQYINEMSDPSSNNEDRPPPSEELFFESELANPYDEIMQRTQYKPRLTLLQQSLLQDLACYVLHENDEPSLTRAKLHHRLQLIRDFCKELKRKRYAKAFRRLSKCRAKHLELDMEAMELMERELMDKNLMRLDYYGKDEPPEFKNILLAMRRNAITRKFLRYKTDPEYRQAFRNRVYYNVNQDIPNDDQLHETWTARKQYNQPQFSHEDGPPVESDQLLDYSNRTRTKIPTKTHRGLLCTNYQLKSELDDQETETDVISKAYLQSNVEPINDRETQPKSSVKDLNQIPRMKRHKHRSHRNNDEMVRNCDPRKVSFRVSQRHLPPTIRGNNEYEQRFQSGMAQSLFRRRPRLASSAREHSLHVVEENKSPARDNMPVLHEIYQPYVIEATRQRSAQRTRHTPDMENKQVFNYPVTKNNVPSVSVDIDSQTYVADCSEHSLPAFESDDNLPYLEQYEFQYPEIPTRDCEYEPIEAGPPMSIQSNVYIPKDCDRASNQVFDGHRPDKTIQEEQPNAAELNTHANSVCNPNLHQHRRPVNDSTTKGSKLLAALAKQLQMFSQQI